MIQVIDREKIRKNVTRNLQRLMESKGISRRELAERTGIPYISISQTCTGRSIPSIAAIAAIADALDVSVDDLISPSPPRRNVRPMGRKLVESR